MAGMISSFGAARIALRSFRILDNLHRTCKDEFIILAHYAEQYKEQSTLSLPPQLDEGQDTALQTIIKHAMDIGGPEIVSEMMLQMLGLYHGRFSAALAFIINPYMQSIYAFINGESIPRHTIAEASGRLTSHLEGQEDEMAKMAGSALRVTGKVLKVVAAAVTDATDWAGKRIAAFAKTTILNILEKPESLPLAAFLIGSYADIYLTQAYDGSGFDEETERKLQYATAHASLVKINANRHCVEEIVEVMRYQQFFKGITTPSTEEIQMSDYISKIGVQLMVLYEQALRRSDCHGQMRLIF